MQGSKVLLPVEAEYRIFERKKKGSDEIIKVEEVVFNGRKYYRNSEGSVVCSHYFWNGKRSLHRDIYEYYFGKIAEGNHIHHKNGYNDNRPEALISLTEQEHAEMHCKEESGLRSKESITKLAEYHSSWQGRKEHGRVSKTAWENGAHDCTVVCIDCGKEFNARVKTTKRCTECKYKWNLFRKRKAYKGMERYCAVCGKPITGASSTSYCSEHRNYWKRPEYKRKRHPESL